MQRLENDYSYCNCFLNCFKDNIIINSSVNEVVHTSYLLAYFSRSNPHTPEQGLSNCGRVVGVLSAAKLTVFFLGDQQSDTGPIRDFQSYAYQWRLSYKSTSRILTYTKKHSNLRYTGKPNSQEGDKQNNQLSRTCYKRGLYKL